MTWYEQERDYHIQQLHLWLRIAVEPTNTPADGLIAAGYAAAAVHYHQLAERSTRPWLTEK